MTTASEERGGSEIGSTREALRALSAASIGNFVEWYDFAIYSYSVPIIATIFFPPGDRTTAVIAAFALYGVAFLARPLGGVFWGNLGDKVGRRNTLAAVILIMGGATMLIGLLPTYDTIGLLAPTLLAVLRLVQGFSGGGEFTGSTSFITEYAPENRRGLYAATSATFTTLPSILGGLTVLAFTAALPEDAYASWGWRIPFLMSVVLLAISVWIRMQMQESPAFKKMKEEGSLSKAPLTEAFGQWKNAKIALLALLGLVAGQAVVWYTGQFYALFFLQNILKVDAFTSNVLIAWSLVLGTGGFVVFGALSDRIGRKPIILAGCLIAALTYFPLFKLMTATANPALHAAQESTQVTIIADPADCSFQFNPTGTAKFTNSCDVAKALLARSSVNATTVNAPGGTIAKVRIGDKEFAANDPNFAKDVGAALSAAGYPGANNPTIVRIPIDPKAGLANFAQMFDIFSAQKLTLIAILTVLVIYVTMVYGPIAAALVEFFPTRIRYTGLSLPYHIGNGWFGGLLPATSFAMVAQTGDIYFGLWYPIVVALMTFVIGTLFVPETYRRDIFKQ